MGMPSCGRIEAIAMEADDALIQAMRESCGRLCSNESFMTEDHIPVMCCNSRYFTYWHESDLKVNIFRSGNVLMINV